MSDSAEDNAAATRADVYMNQQYLDPALLGRVPEGLREIYGDAWVEFPAEDFELIREPIDFLGFNYYTRGGMKHDEDAWPMRATKASTEGPGHMQTGWEVHPGSLTRALCWVKERYGDIPIYITENGGAFDDPPADANGRIDDAARVSYYREHLLATLEAIRRGVDVRGYFAWSLLDNFEWASGYAITFGLLHVDHATQVRTMKASAEFYREVIRTHGDVLAGG